MANILIVDDDETIVAVVKKVIVELGHMALGARDGRQAIELLEKHKFDLVITDANMPGISGFNLVQVTKTRRASFGDPRILMLTGRRTKVDVGRALAVGVDDYLMKPIDFDVLRAKIQSLLRPDYGEIQKIPDYEMQWTIAMKVLRLTDRDLEILSPVSFDVGAKLQLSSSLFQAIGINPELTVETISKGKDGYRVSFNLERLADTSVDKIRAWLAKQSAA